MPSSPASLSTSSHLTPSSSFRLSRRTNKTRDRQGNREVCPLVTREPAARTYLRRPSIRPNLGPHRLATGAGRNTNVFPLAAPCADDR
jgi:hypothetical protein